MIRRVEGWQKGEFCVGENSCNSQITKEGSKSTLLVATVWSLFIQQTETMSTAKGREAQPVRVSNKPCDQTWAHFLTEQSGAQSIILLALLEVHVCFRNDTLECKPQQ